MKLNLLEFILNGKLSPNIVLKVSTFEELKTNFPELDQTIWYWKNEHYDGDDYTAYLFDRMVEFWFSENVITHIRIKFPFVKSNEYAKYLLNFESSEMMNRSLEELVNHLTIHHVDFILGQSTGADYEVRLILKESNILISYNTYYKRYFSIDQGTFRQYDESDLP